MTARKSPRSPARQAPQPAKHTKKSKPAPLASKGNVKVALPASSLKVNATYDQRVKRVETGKAIVRAPSEKPDAFARLDALASLDSLTLPELGDLPPLFDAEAEDQSLTRVYGPEVDESPITDRSEDGLTHEDEESIRLAELHKGFRERMANEAKRRELATDSEFWLTVVFQDRDQKDEFIRKAKWTALGDKYLDGERLADVMGVKLTPSQIVYHSGGSDLKLAQLVDIDPLARLAPTGRKR